MSGIPADEMRRDLPGGDELGVMDALGMGWAFLKADFWPRWLMAFVMSIILMGIALVFGLIPYVGGCCSTIANIFVQPPLMAGLIFAIVRCIDGGPADVGLVFEGFRQRYWQSVVAALPPTLAGLAVGLIVGGGVVAVVIIGEESGDDELAAILGIVTGVVGLALFIAVIVFSLFFTFALVCVWDHPESGWEAAKASMRLVKAHFWSVVGFAIMAFLIGLAAGILGLLGLCVGLLFTVPVASLWLTTALVYLFRSWTGQALVQPLGEAPEAEGGALPPTAVEPPATPPGL